MSIARLVRLLQEDYARRKPARHPVIDPDPVLTPQELAVAYAAARGLSVREIGQSCFLSTKTVEHHLTRVYQKLHIRSRQQLAALVIDYLLADSATSTGPHS